MNVLRQQLVAAREAAKALAASIDAALAGMAEKPMRVPGSPCEHPAEARISAPAMGNPARWVCGICNQPGPQESDATGGGGG